MSVAVHMPWVLVGAMALEGLVGYPSALYRTIGHPVSWMGRGLSLGERLLNSHGNNAARDFISGTAWLVFLGALVGAAAWSLSGFLREFAHGWIVELILITTLIAGRSLYDHVAAVKDALSGPSIEEAREKVGLIVGRNPDNLDEPAIARAAVESLAENASDGVIAPLFWGLTAGLPGIVIYKLVNTADSMWGHRNERYEWFGKSAARLDDFLNLVPARITGFLFCLSALGRARGGAAVHAMVKDAPRHLSPNAGWPEAAMAGALGRRLGGPRNYGGQKTEGAWLGAGSADLKAGDIGRALHLYLAALLIAVTLLLLTGFVLGLVL